MLGSTGGAETHALITAELATHSHGVTDPGHAHGLTDLEFTGAFNTGSGTNENIHSGVNVTNNSFTGISIQNTGSGTAHLNAQPTMVTNCIMFAGD